MVRPKLNPADFRHRITFQQKADNSVNSNGFRVPDSRAQWSDVVTVWANAKTPKLYQGLEDHQNNSTQNTRNIRFIIRYRKGLSEDMRVLFEGRVFQVEAIINDDELRQTMTVVCKEVV